jgi:hypothetical protein
VDSIGQRNWFHFDQFWIPLPVQTTTLSKQNSPEVKNGYQECEDRIVPRLDDHHRLSTLQGWKDAVGNVLEHPDNTDKKMAWRINDINITHTSSTMGNR